MSDFGGGGGGTTTKPAAPTFTNPYAGNPGAFGPEFGSMTDQAKLIGASIANNPASFPAPIPDSFQKYLVPGPTPASLSSLPPLPQMPTFNLNADPGVLNSLALEQQGLSQLDSGLKSARERAIISFGDPALAQEAGFGLDPQAGAFARQNYLSGNATLARLDKQHQLARKAVIDRLVAHGLLGSGDLGYGQGQADQSYGNQVYDAKQQLLDYLANLFQSYNDRRTSLQQGTNQARLQAISNFLANPDTYSAAFGG